MITITVPASSANLGPGFDCLGLALDLYAYFDVDISPDNDNHLSGFLSQYINNENLFLKAYRRGWKAIVAATGPDRPPYPLTVQFHSDVPISRGLGSSMTMVAGGLMAASVFGSEETDKPLGQRRALTPAQLFELSAKMEGHPDNAAPALFGGLTAALVTDDGPIYMPLPLSDKWQFTVFIPDFEVDIFGTATIVNDKGQTAQLAFGMDNDYRCDIEVWGSKGTITSCRIFTAPQDYVPTYTLKKNQELSKYELPQDDAFYKSVIRFLDCIYNDERRKENYNIILKQEQLIQQFRDLCAL